jgi:hypothetical protein
MDNTTWPWPCLGCGGQITRRATGRTPRCCSDTCRSAAWRDLAAGRKRADLIRPKAERRIAREAEPPRITPGERNVIMYAWIGALGGLCGDDPDRRQIHSALMDEAVAGTCPEPFACAAATGTWPGYDGYVEVVFRERMKLSALDSIRARRDDRGVPKGVSV